MKTTKNAAKTAKTVVKIAKMKNLAARKVKPAAKMVRKANLAAKTAKVKMVSLVEKTKAV